MYTVTYENRPGYLYVHMDGPESLEAAIRFWESLAFKAREEGIKAFLIVDEVVGQLEAMEIYKLSVAVADLFRGATIAYVDPKEDTFDANKFGEVVVRNRGVYATVFHSEAEAIEWLKREDATA